MRATTSLQFYSIFLLLLTTFTAASPWPQWLPEMDALIVRQDSSAAQAPPSKAANSASQTPAPQSSGSASTVKQTGSASDKNSPSDAAATTGQTTGPITPAAKTPAPANHTSYGNDNPAGAITLLTPAVNAGSQFYKVGDNVTFAWNYTNLLATPTALNVWATNSQASNYFTMTSNMTIGGDATNAVTWDTADYTNSPSGLTDPLLTGIYTLIIFDADSEVTATAEPGYLAVYNQYQFGMYTPQPYTNLADGYVCATCSGAMGDREKRAIGFAFGMGLATVLGFTWFVAGTGVIW
jgi:hypothetical protein